MDRLQKLFNYISEYIVPSEAEVSNVLNIAEGYRLQIYELFKDVIEDYNDVYIGGSVARGTFFKDDFDIDIFIRFPPTLDIEYIKGMLFTKLSEIFPKDKIRKRYAEHPYAEIIFDEYSLNVVPSFKTQYPSWLSPADRSYYHNQYLKERIKPYRRDVILAKSLFKGIGVYGAEVYIGGLSGYLTELLVLHYRGLENLLNAIAKWRPPVIIDIEKLYSSQKEIRNVFEGYNLIVVDPVDKGRNVAAALTKRKFSMLISGVKAFLSDPKPSYFHIFSSERTKPEYNYRELIKSHPIIVIDLVHEAKIEDIHYPQLTSFARKIVRQLEYHGFNVYKYAVFSDYLSRSIAVILLSSDRQPKYTVYTGPYPYLSGESSFLEKNKGLIKWIGYDGRWYVLKTPKYSDVYSLITDVIDKGLIKPPKELYKKYSVYRLNLTHLKRDRKLFSWIKEFIVGDEFWKEHI
ncbi:CCA tRNA nucleotidyltransferase [Candidatus Geothermarchaeota archaeon]|nr:MAG: CCA tRNA nucleotidyltransferase [Candidatus Geothermarchaeota archaeon]HEW93456.1 CCA tRNA nucleotidyltransferase [Thermoprotei archaeon]